MAHTFAMVCHLWLVLFKEDFIPELGGAIKRSFEKIGIFREEVLFGVVLYSPSPKHFML
jgi:hypothetical protein